MKHQTKVRILDVSTSIGVILFIISLMLPSQQLPITGFQHNILIASILLVTLAIAREYEKEKNRYGQKSLEDFEIKLNR